MTSMTHPSDNVTQIESPVGPLTIEVDGDGALTRIEFVLRPERPGVRGPLFPPVHAASRGPRSPNRHLQQVIDELDEYFMGKRRTFNVTLAPRGTPFQLRVWNELLAIPYGETVSYLQLATRIDKPSAVRAVGAANGANPIPVIIPCHRVIGSGGKLVGYGGGLDRKETLLAIERKLG